MGTPMRNNKTMMGNNITLKRHIDKTKATKVDKKKNWDNKGLQGIEVRINTNAKVY
jgi:hypothetical protein